MKKNISTAKNFFILISFISLICQNLLFSQWVQIGPLNGPNVYSIVVRGSIIFSGTQSGIFISGNGGQSWIQTFSNFTQAFALNGSTALAGLVRGVYYSGIFRSTNQGRDLIQTSFTNGNIYSIYYRDAKVFAGTWGLGIYTSTDDGQNWTAGGLNSKNVLCFTDNDSAIFAGTYFFGVYMSTDEGQTWIQTALNSQNVRTLIAKGHKLFAGTESFGVYISTNNGNNWTQTSLNNQLVYSLAVWETVLFAGTDSNGVYMTTDEGASWVEINEGMGKKRINSLFTTTDYIYAGTQGSSVWRRPLPDIINVEGIGFSVPAQYSLTQNYPNPFNPSTTIDYQLPKSGFVKISVFNVLGQEVKSLVNEFRQAGSYSIRFDASEMPSGVYFYKLISGDFTSTKKMALIK